LLIALLLSVDKYLKWREHREFCAAAATVQLLDSYKQRIVMERNMTYGSHITLQDLKPYLSDLSTLAPDVVDDETMVGSFIQPKNADWIYILGPVGFSAKVRFIREVDGHAAGSEITAQTLNQLLK
jgi:hypothetical protein